MHAVVLGLYELNSIATVEFDRVNSAHLLKYKSYGRGARVPLRKWAEGRKYTWKVFMLMTALIQQLCWFESVPRGIPRMAKVMRRPYPQVCLCQDCGNRTPGAIKHHITLHLTPSNGNVSSIPLPVPLLDQNLNLIARKHKYRWRIPLPDPFATHLCLVSVVSKHKLSLTSFHSHKSGYSRHLGLHEEFTTRAITGNIDTHVRFNVSVISSGVYF